MKDDTDSKINRSLLSDISRDDGDGRRGRWTFFRRRTQRRHRMVVVLIQVQVLVMQVLIEDDISSL